MKDQQGSKKKDLTDPTHLAFPRFFSLLLGDDLIGSGIMQGPLLKAGKVVKINEMKTFNPSHHPDGYDAPRPLFAKLLGYLGKEDKRAYGRGKKTLAPEPAIPPRIGFLVGQIYVYVKGEDT